MSKANKVVIGDELLNRDYPHAPAPHERMVDFRKRVARRTEGQDVVGETVVRNSTPERAGKSDARRNKPKARSERLSPELPTAIRQLLGKGTLTSGEGDIVAKFRGDYDLAFYSSPGLTSRYGEPTGGGGNGVAAARAAVTDARERMRAAQDCMTAGCWDVLIKMTVFDIAQVNVGGAASRYKDPKGRRYAAGILLIEALSALEKVYR